MNGAISLFAATTMLAASANAQSQAWPEGISNRLNDLNHRFLQCSAFFSVMAYSMYQQDNSRENDTPQQYIQYGEKLRNRATRIAAELNMKPKAITAQWELSAKKLLAEMSDPSSDFSTIVNSHLGPCIDLDTGATRHIREAIFGQ